MRLSDLQTGDKAVVVKVLGYGAFRKRIIEMGFVRGQTVLVELNAPLKDPIKYKIMDYEISLRRSEASLVEVITPEEANQLENRQGGKNKLNVENWKTEEDDCIERALTQSSKTINIALVGNPNCGKTSLFNVASGAHEHVGNYSGVTVDAKKGFFEYKGYHFNICDLPGTYSLSAYSPEELYVRRYLKNEIPDVIVNVVVASNLERNLYLTTELIDMDYRMVIALNMFDELEQSGGKIDYKHLGNMIGVPIVPTVSRSGKGVNQLFDTIIEVYEGRDESVRHVHVGLGKVIENSITPLKDLLKKDPTCNREFSPRYLAIKILEGDTEVKRMLEGSESYPELMNIRNAEVEKIETTLNEDIESAIANEMYGFISGALAETYSPGDKEQAKTTRIIDSFVTNKLFGFPIFIFLMWLMFEAISRVTRPEEEGEWQYFSSSKKIGWKTGTSYGNRDAWAVGATPDYAVGVWVGNCSGEGRPLMPGVGYAAPLLFEVFGLLSGGEWFAEPHGDLEAAVVCRQSGCLASHICPDRDTLMIPRAAAAGEVCPYHRIVNLSRDLRYRVTADC